MVKSGAKTAAWIGAVAVVVAAIIQGVFQLFSQSPTTTKNSTVSNKSEVVHQMIRDSPQSVQIGRDLNVTNNLINIPIEKRVPQRENASPPTPIARFSVDHQLAQAKQRIKYLAYEYLHNDVMSLVEVAGPYGDNILDSPNLYDWPMVMEELEKQGYVKILSRTHENIEFKVIRPLFDVRTAGPEPQPKNVVLTTAAWSAFNAKDYLHAITKAQECIDKFRGSADREQAELEKEKAPPLPKGKVTEVEKQAIFVRGLLNDVGTCYFIIGRSAEYLDRKDIAQEAYTHAARYTYARTWDPGGWFWSPAEAAEDRLAGLK